MHLASWKSLERSSRLYGMDLSDLPAMSAGKRRCKCIHVCIAINRRMFANNPVGMHTGYQMHRANNWPKTCK